LNLNALIAVWDKTLMPGQSSREPCPKCRAFEQAFVVTKQQDNNLVWMCHRASCGFKGGTSTCSAEIGSVNLRRHADPPELQLSDYSKDNGGNLDLIFGMSAKFGINIGALRANGVRWDALSKGYYLPIYAADSFQIGFTLRWYDGRIPKCRTYLTVESGCATMAWYRQPAQDDWVIVVEDQVSAIKLWDLGYSAVALLGTYIDKVRAWEISKEYCNMLIWLDTDASKTAASYLHKFRLYFDTIAWMGTEHDPKDTPSAEITTTLGEFFGAQTNRSPDGPECI